jgi:NADPH-dependent 2,4-dienoyl-CoA reductase/sulfur reductase-like enzyme
MPERKRILIVGGVAGGASAATRARRLSEDAEIVLFERGEHVSFANCGMPYHIGGAIRERGRLLVQTPEGLRQRYRLDVRTRTEVVRIDRAAREVLARNLATGEETEEPYDALILSPGAAPIRPPIPGADHPLVFTLRTLGDMDRNYSQITFIEMGVEPDGSFEQRARDDAKARGWKFVKIQGDMGMIQRLRDSINYLRNLNKRQ